MKTYRIFVSHAGDTQFVTVLPEEGASEHADAHARELRETPGQRVATSYVGIPYERLDEIFGTTLRHTKRDLFLWDWDNARAAKFCAVEDAEDWWPAPDYVEDMVYSKHCEAISVDDFRKEVEAKSAAARQSAVEAMDVAAPNQSAEWTAPESVVEAKIRLDEDARNKAFDDVKHDAVNGPKHYDAGRFECIDVLEAALSHEELCGFLRGNVVKYHFRAINKGGIEDIFKAGWYQRRLEKVLAEDRDGDSK